MTEHKHAAVLRAIADGREVEVRLGGNWYIPAPDINPLTYHLAEWRIKPEPRTPREGWVMPGGFYPLSQDPMEAYGEKGKQAIYVREVLPDDGGPVYPCTLRYPFSSGTTTEKHHPGMSLRAEFAKTFAAAWLPIISQWHAGSITTKDAYENANGVGLAMADDLLRRLREGT